jgi:hypothetical protein
MTRQRILQHILRIVSIFTILALVAVFLVALLIVVQGQRDESRSTEALLVLPTTKPSPLLVDHILDLYHQGYAPQILLVGQDMQPIYDALVEKHQPEATLLLLETAQNPALYEAIVGTYQQGIQTVLLIDRPETMLLHLKMARDMGMNAYGSPLPTTPNPGALMLASLTYWRYVLFEGYVTVMKPDQKEPS